MGRRHILEGLSHRWLCEPCGIGHYLGGLPSCGVSARPEIGPVLYARLPRASATVSCHHASPGQAVDPVIEGRAWRYVLEDLRVRVFREAGSIAHHLGELTTCYFVVGPESAITVATHHTRASQAAYERIECRAWGYVSEGDSACRGG